VVLDRKRQWRCSSCGTASPDDVRTGDGELRCLGCGAVRGFVDNEGRPNFFVDPQGVTTLLPSYWTWSHPGARPFCLTCTRETTSESSGSVSSVNGSGTMLYGNKHPCPSCRSTVKRLFFTIFFIPVFPAGKYRVIYSSGGFLSGTFHSRRLRS
jgi:hypothetical protein